MTEEQDSDTIVKTKASQDDKVEEFDENEEIITIEDDEDSVNQYKTAETKYFKPIVLTKTGKNFTFKNCKYINIYVSLITIINLYYRSK